MVHRLYGKFESAQSALESRVELLQDYRVFFSKVLNSDHELLPQLEFSLTRSCGYQRKMLSLAKRLDTISEMVRGHLTPVKGYADMRDTRRFPEF